MFSFKLTETTYAALLPEAESFSHLQHHDSPALLCFTKISITAAGLQGQCLTTAVLRDQNRYISENSSKDVNEFLTGERESLFMPTVRRELRCCKTSPKFPSSLGCRQQSPASVHTASWTNSKTPSLAASLAWAKPHSVQLSSAAGWDSKQQNPDYREKGRGQT